MASGILSVDKAEENQHTVAAIMVALASKGDAADSHQPATRSITATFVGRELELEELRSALPDEVRARGRFFLVCGEPGIGKTRLVEELASEAVGLGIRVLWGRCWEGGGAPAFWPWLQILRACLRGPGTDLLRAQPLRHLRELAQILPEIDGLLGSSVNLSTVSASGEEDQEAARFRLHDAITSILKALASQQPMLLILEDIHAADLPTLRLLHFATHDLFDAPLTVMATYRQGEALANPLIADRIDQLGQNGQLLPLVALSRNDVQRFIAIAVGKVLPRVASAIYTATEGNAFFVTEILRVLVAERRLDEIDEEQLQAALPHRVRDAVQRHLDPLSEDTRQLLVAASVFGKEFDLAVLERVTPAGADHVQEPGSGLRDRLNAAIAAGVIVNGASADRFSFSHALVREALYSELPPARRGDLHRAAAAALESFWSTQGRPPFTELAHHYLAGATSADIADKAIHYSRLAGDQAMQCLAFEEARLHYQHALECIERWHGDLTDAGIETRRGELLQALAWAHRQSGDSDQASQVFLRVTQLAREIGAVELFAQAATDLEPFQVGSLSTRQVALLEEALRMLPPGDSPQRARTLATLATALYQSPDIERRDTMSRAAVDMARRLGDPHVLSHALRCRELAIWVPELLDERVEAAREHLALALRLGDLTMIRQMYVWQVLGAFEHGDIAEVERAKAGYEHVEGADREPLYQWIGANWRTALALTHGRFAEAEELANQSLTIGIAVQREYALAAYSAQLLVARYEQGRCRDYLETLEAALLQAPDQRAEVPAILALAYAESGRLSEARQQFEQLAVSDFGAVPKDLNWLAIMVMLASVCSTLRDRERAEKLHQLLIPFAARVAIISTAVASWGAVARFLGLLSTTLERWDEAIAHFEEAEQRHAAMQAPSLLARTRLEHAETLLRAGRPPSETKQLLQQVLLEARHLDLPVLAHRATTMLDALAAFPPDRDVAVEATIPPKEIRTCFLREGEMWTLSFEGVTVRFKHARGFSLLALLLRHAGTEIHALELLNQESPASDSPLPPSDAGEIIDLKAQADYKRRLREIQEELQEAKEFHDRGRIETLQEEQHHLTQELSRGLGLGGRERRANSAAERARINVTRSISLALKRIAEHHEPLARHLQRTVRTGSFCIYAPDPRAPIDWEVG